MSELRETLADWREGMRLLGFSPDNVNWQSIAVLIDNLPDKRERVKERLLNSNSGWWQLGMVPGSDGTSLYLSPKGMAYWLNYGGHYGLYWDLLHLEQDKLDKAGWLHISAGRVDVRCRMTPAQQRWLANHRPHHESLKAVSGDWQIKPYYHNSAELPAERYLPSERFDVRPVDSIDLDEGWDRLMLRIHQARHGNAGTE